MFNFYNFRVILIILSMGLLLNGCSSNKSEGNKPYKKHIPTTPLHTAIIKLEREGLWTGFGHDFEVYDNNNKVGTLKDGRTVSWIRPPGDMIIKIDEIEGYHPLTLHSKISSGNEYKFKFTSNGYMGGWSNPGIKYLGSKTVKMVKPSPEFKYPQEFEHAILGSTAVRTGFYFIKENIKVGDLNIRRVRKPEGKCSSGYVDHLELDGEINEDTSFIIERMLDDTIECKHSNGRLESTIVYLNSFGGKLKDGYKIGKVFKKHQVFTKVVYGQVCASSCAIAFLGAPYKSMSPDSSLILHAPYTKKFNQKIHCADEKTDAGMRDYLSQMLGEETSDVIFNRTMKYCSEDSGWTVNRDAAKIYGMLD